MSDNEDVGSEPTCFIISPGLKAPAPTKDAPPSASSDVGSAVLQLKQFGEVRSMQQVMSTEQQVQLLLTDLTHAAEAHP
jgi:hypothetical protein